MFGLVPRKQVQTSQNEGISVLSDMNVATEEFIFQWKLKKSMFIPFQSTLEFNLREQEFIELMRSGRRLEAVK